MQSSKKQRVIFKVKAKPVEYLQKLSLKGTVVTA